MNKNIKNALIVVGIAAAALLLLSWAKPKKPVPEPSVLSEDEKKTLFMSANRGYTGGAAPPQEILDEIEKERNAALAKISELGLDAEYRSYLASLPPPDPNAPTPN